jgi:hypothetical protein
MSSELLPRLQSLIRAEAEQQRYELRKQWSLPLPERVARGYAIEGLEVTAIRPDGTLLLSCQTNDSRFREGDFLAIHRGDPETPERLSGVLEYDDETELEIDLTEGNIDILKTNPTGWIVDEDMLDLSRFYLEALDQVADRLLGRERILPLLYGEKGPNIDYARYSRSWEDAMAAGLNESQAEAVAQRYAASGHRPGSSDRVPGGVAPVVRGGAKPAPVGRRARCADRGEHAQGIHGGHPRRAAAGLHVCGGCARGDQRFDRISHGSYNETRPCPFTRSHSPA